MKVKVQCPCGSRFEFEVEPVNGQMPMAINCPTCGADATQLANVVIRQQSAPAAPSLRIAKSHFAPPAAAVAVAPVPASAETSGTEFCPKHKKEPAIETCRVCGKPICEKCMEQFGYLCSVYCRQQAVQKRISIPACAYQKDIGADRTFQFFKIAALAVIVLAVAGFGFWGWYGWFARNPKVVYSLSTPPHTGGMRPAEYFQLIAPGQLLSIKNKQASLFDISKQREVWTAPLPVDVEANNDLSYASAAVTTNDIWLAISDRVLRLDRQTGQQKEPAIHGKILSFSSAADALMAIYVNPDGQPMLSRISLPDGAIQTTNLLVVPTAPVAAARNPKASKLASVTAESDVDKTAALTDGILHSMHSQSSASVPLPFLGAKSFADTNTSFAPDPYDVPPFVLSGQSVVQLKAALLERKTIAHEAVKPKGKSLLDDGNITASQSLDLAQEMANDAQRDSTGGVEIEDVSRFRVTLHRWFADDAPEWAGEVAGPPVVYSLKTVDLLIAGQSLLVFDKHNKKLWDGKLTYALRSTGSRPPILETGGALYLADPGVLTRFDLATGNVRWRLDSVGICSLQADARQNLYIASTTAGPDQITHPHQVNLRDKIHPLIMKVNPENGRVIWRSEADGADCFMSGKFFYTMWVTRVQSVMRFEEGPDTHYNLWLIDPSTGNEIWEYHKINHPILKTEIQKNWILLQTEDGVTVLKFFSL